MNAACFEQINRAVLDNLSTENSTTTARDLI
jgi:hypothetical protein